MQVIQQSHQRVVATGQGAGGKSFTIAEPTVGQEVQQWNPLLLLQQQ